MHNRTLTVLLIAIAALLAAPQATSRPAASPKLYLKVAGYRASVDTSPGGTLVGECSTYCTFAFPTGTTSITLRAKPAFGTSFVGWMQAFSGWTPPSCGTELTCRINLVSPVAVKAAFSPVSLSFRTSGDGDVEFLDNRTPCGSDCRLYQYDAIARVRAKAGEDYAFAGWSGGLCSSAGPTCSVRMNANQNLTANFACTSSDACRTAQPIVHPTPVRVRTTGQGYVTDSRFNCPPTCVRSIERGTIISLQAKAKSGATFRYWLVRGVTCSQRAERCTFQVMRNARNQSPYLVAVFRP